MTTSTSAPRARGPVRLGRRERIVFDITLVGGLLLFAGASGYAGFDVVTAVLTTTMLLTLLVRRSHPIAAFGLLVALSLVQVALTDIPVFGQVALPVALYSVARFTSAVPAAVALAVGLVGAVVATYDWRILPADLGAGTAARFVLSIAAIVVAAWALGTTARIRRAYEDTLVERADRIERQAAQQVALAASDERARIAREMHDVVAHALSVVVVQADGARYAAAHDPDVATATLGRIAATGRSALADMRQLLGLLRTDETGTRPLPGLSDLPALLEETGATGELHGLEQPVSGAVALTAYRTTQEALTNVVKHAGPGARAHVEVRVGSQAVEVRVVDDGRGGGADPADPGGHGLIGMRERVDLHGGTMRHGPRPGGGYEVALTLPRGPT